MTTTTSTTAFGEPGRARPGVAAFGRTGTVVGLAVVVAVVAATLALVALGSASAASRPDLFGGSLVLDDQRPLTVVNLATGEVTVQLAGVSDQVGASSYGQVQAVRATGGTWLINRSTGTFNLLAEDNYVVDPTGGGVGLGSLTGAVAAQGYASGTDAYIVRQAPASTVSLVDPTTVAEAARTATAGTAASIAPRGFASLPGQVVLRPGAATVSGGALWVLVTTPTACEVVTLSPTSGGRGLAARTRARTASCTDDDLASAGGLVGLFTPGRVQTWAGPVHRSVAVAATTGSTASVPATDTGAGPVGAAPELWWMVRTSGGWDALGATAAGPLSGPTPLRGIPVTATPAPPEYADSRLFTLDQAAAGQPELWVADPVSGAVGTVAGVATYPAASAAEQAGFSGAEVTGSGPRVVYNNPASLLAVVVFTDGSHAPVVIDKSSAVVVAATGPASIASQSPPPTHHGRDKGGSTTSPTTTPTSHAAPTVDQQVNCATTTEKPYAPQITAVVPASETALVSWSYQTLAVQDCEPDSWSVTLTALNAPQPAARVQTVNGQQELDVAGLRPTTQYRAVVTAYINKEATASLPVTFTTAQRGPDAPTSVRTSIDANGDWVVSWTPCQSAHCYVPADQWTVTGRACGSGYLGQPPSTVVSGSTDEVTFDASALGLLGQSASFEVQGSLADGLQGNPRSDGTCTQAWRAPEAGAIALQAAGVVAGQSVTATLQVTPPAGTAAVYGGLQPEFTYHVGSATVGPTTATTVTVPGLAPNSTYTPSVTVTPAGHPTAAVTVRGTPFSQNLSWSPGLALTATPHVDSDPNTGTVDATFSDLAPGSYTTSGTITCGSVATQVSAPVSGSSVSFPGFDLVNNGGDCSLSLTLHDTASPDPYGVDSPALDAAVNWGPAPQYGFSASYTQTCAIFSQCTTTVQVTSDSSAALGGANWSVVAALQQPIGHGPGNNSCQDQEHYPQPPTSVTLTLDNCPPTQVDPVTVTVGWHYFGQDQSVQATVNGQSGTVPTTTTTAPTSTTVPTSSTTTPSTTTPSSTTPSSTTATTAAVGAGVAGATGPTDLAAARLAERSGSAAPLLVACAVGGAVVAVGSRRRRRPRRRGGPSGEDR